MGDFYMPGIVGSICMQGQSKGVQIQSLALHIDSVKENDITKDKWVA